MGLGKTDKLMEGDGGVILICGSDDGNVTSFLPIKVNVDGTIKSDPHLLDAVSAISGTTPYNFIQESTEGSYTYYGFASSTGWKIKRESSAGIWTVAQGDGDYDTNWVLRADKTYSYTI